MYSRHIQRKKDGKEHSYWSIVAGRRLADGRVSRRHVLYLGEIDDAQERAWARAVEVFPGEAGPPQTMALFPEERLDAKVEEGTAIVRRRLKELSLHRPRQWGACRLALYLWREPRWGKVPARGLALITACSQRGQAGARGGLIGDR